MKKLGLEIEDVIIKGHTYKKIVIPEDFLKGVGEIDAYKKGGATNKSIEINLTPEEIKKYVNGGYVVEEIDNFQDGGITNDYIEADYQLGDEVDEDTMKTLKKLGYTFNKI